MALDDVVLGSLHREALVVDRLKLEVRVCERERIRVTTSEHSPRTNVAARGEIRVGRVDVPCRRLGRCRSEEHTSELQSLMRISYDVFCLKNKHNNNRRAQDITSDST